MILTSQWCLSQFRFLLEKRSPLETFLVSKFWWRAALEAHLLPIGVHPGQGEDNCLYLLSVAKHISCALINLDTYELPFGCS